MRVALNKMEITLKWRGNRAKKKNFVDFLMRASSLFTTTRGKKATVGIQD